MKFEKRRCIFTNQISDAKLKVSKRDRYNWAKSVPCTKTFLEKKGDRSLTDHEFELVELFFAKEVALAKISNIELKMKETRSKLDPNSLPEFEEYEDLTPEEADKATFEADMKEWEREQAEKKISEDWGKVVKEKLDALKADAEFYTQEDKDFMNAPIGPIVTEGESEILTTEEDEEDDPGFWG